MNLADVQLKEYEKYNSKDILRLYDSVGWSSYTDDLVALENGFNNSLKVLAAYKNDELVGIARAVGDGYTVVLIQDIRRCQAGKNTLITIEHPYLKVVINHRSVIRYSSIRSRTPCLGELVDIYTEGIEQVRDPKRHKMAIVTIQSQMV